MSTISSTNATETPDPLASNPFLANLANTFHVTSIPLAIFILICILIGIILFIVCIVLCVRSCLRSKYTAKRQKRRYKGIYVDELPGAAQRSTEFRGQLEYSIYYDLLRENLNVGVIQASDLVSRSGHQLTDSYVKVTVSELQDAELKIVDKAKITKKIYQTCSPVWKDNFTFNVTNANLTRTLLALEVFEYDSLGQDVSLGVVHVPLSSIDQTEYTARTLERSGPLQPSATVTNGEGGEACVILQYSPEDSYVKVTVLEVKQLHVSEVIDEGKVKELLVSVRLEHNGKKHKSHDSPTRTELINPYFDYRCGFTLPEYQVGDTSITIKIRYRGFLGTKHTIAKVLIGTNSPSNTGVRHWSEMVKNERRAVAMWHAVEYKRK